MNLPPRHHPGRDAARPCDPTIPEQGTAGPGDARGRSVPVVETATAP